MLNGKSIRLRPVREADLDQLYTYHLEIDNRGNYYPREVLAGPVFRRQFQETGFWGKADGTLCQPGACLEQRQHQQNHGQQQRPYGGSHLCRHHLLLV